MPDAEEITKNVQVELRGPGSQWETIQEEVLGENFLVFKNRFRTIGDMLEANTSQWADRECLVLGKKRITYLELQKRVDSTASMLQSQYKISKGDRVAILAANSPEWVISFFAITRIAVSYTHLRAHET